MTLVRPARPSDAPRIVEAFRSAFEPDLVRATIYDASGIEDYIADQVTVMLRGGDSFFAVAEQDSRVVGAVELRRAADQLFLNYISLLPDCRSKGMGRRLLGAALEMARTEDSTRIGLDVFASNTVAGQWYERMGFAVEAHTTWWDIPIDAGGAAAGATILGYPQARACYDAFGFAQLRILTPNGNWIVGLMCRDWFRVAHPGALLDPALWAVLRKLDPERRVLAVLCDEETPEAVMSEATPIATSLRMSADLNEVMQHLSQ